MEERKEKKWEISEVTLLNNQYQWKRAIGGIGIGFRAAYINKDVVCLYFEHEKVYVASSACIIRYKEVL